MAKNKKLEKQVRDLNEKGFVVYMNDGTQVIVDDERKPKFPFKGVAIGAAIVTVIGTVVVAGLKLLGGEQIDPEVVEAIAEKVAEATEQVDPDKLIEPLA